MGERPSTSSEHASSSVHDACCRTAPKVSQSPFSTPNHTLGCYFSINGEMLRSPKHRNLVGRLPLDRLLTETDGPFVERDGRPLRPRDVRYTVGELATVRNLSPEATEGAILQNLKRLVSM